MKFTQSVRSVRERIPRLTLLLAVVVALSMFIAACGGDDDDDNGGGGQAQSDVSSEGPAADVTDEQLQEAIRKAFFADVPESEMDAPLVEALRVAAKPLSPELESKLGECLRNTECETGRGDLVVGIADPFGAIPWRVQARTEATAQALAYPEVSKIIYTDAGGDPQQALANFRSLMAQDVDVITGYFDFAAQMRSLIRNATQQGIAVVPYISPVPGVEEGTEIASLVIPDLCEAGTNMANAAIEEVGGEGKGALFTGIPGNASQEWQDCVADELEANGWEVAHEGTTEWTPQGELAAGSRLIASGEDVDAIFYDNTGANLMRAYEREGETPPVVISWANSLQYYNAYRDLPEDAPENFLINGQTWTPRPAVTTAIMKARGDDVPPVVTLPQPIVATSDALDIIEGSVAVDRMPEGYAPLTFAPENIVRAALR